MQGERANVKVALIQSAAVLGDSAWNINRLEAHCRTAAAEGAKILVLPEAAVTGYLSDDLVHNWHVAGRVLRRDYQSFPLTAERAERQNGNAVQHFGRLAMELAVYITVPFVEAGEDGAFYNSVSLVGPRGDSTGAPRALAHYRKNCPWPTPEISWASPGTGVDDAIFETEYGRVGMAICFDIHTILAKYADKNLWALLYPIAWVGNTEFWFAHMLPSKLKKVNCPFHVLGANWATRAPPSWPGAGGSAAYGPRGKLLAISQGCWGEDIVYASIPTASHMKQVGALDIEAYAQWSNDQIGTDFWTRSPDWHTRVLATPPPPSSAAPPSPPVSE
eukprot:gnl/Spiro4/23816_TR11781_c0_g1_i1.p1 gnl/Spiro4/23816_TR11781_c0_g1~~gnl/Spiro4/23816_TR11781_c0_g1_i1.p1  ORF type:complete len:333 (-),score=50.96 gnl/Spiro4/23816_TR11781_c0_g1_i1:52-1050(-)